MISFCQVIVRSPGQDPLPLVGSSAKTLVSSGASAAEPQSDPKANRPESPDPSAEALSNQSSPVQHSLTALLSPIADMDQAAIATQQARRLIQAQPTAAMIAQANAHSQSVQRLLQ